MLHQINPEELAGQVSKGLSGALSELGLPNPQSTGGGALQEGKMSSADSLPALAGLTAALAPAPLPQELAKVKNAVGTLQDSAAIVAKQFQAQQDQMAAAVNRDSTTSFKKKVICTLALPWPMVLLGGDMIDVFGGGLSMSCPCPDGEGGLSRD